MDSALRGERSAGQPRMSGLYAYRSPVNKPLQAAVHRPLGASRKALMLCCTAVELELCLSTCSPHHVQDPCARLAVTCTLLLLPPRLQTSIEFQSNYRHHG